MKNLLPAGYAHTGWQHGGVPEEGKIGRTYTIFDFLTYFLGARTPDPLRYATSALWPPTPHVKYIPGGHPHLPQTNLEHDILLVLVCVWEGGKVDTYEETSK